MKDQGDKTEPAHEPDWNPAALFLGTIISGEDRNKYLGKTVYEED